MMMEEIRGMLPLLNLTLKLTILFIALSERISYKEVIISKQELGSGKWGSVTLGIFCGQHVAIKQMNKTLSSQEWIRQSDHEIHIMAQLRHSNIIRFIGVLDHPMECPMIITELMDTSLITAYESKELTPDTSCRPVILSIMLDVAIGLNYLHSLPDPILHRDIGSDNVLLKSMGPMQWKAKISDFGSANFARLSVNPYPAAKAYAAPETIGQTSKQLGMKQTPKIDSFSYGILLSEVLTCQFPLRNILHTLLQQVRIISNSLFNLISSCVEEEPEKRPTMEEIREKIDGHWLHHYDIV